MMSTIVLIGNPFGPSQFDFFVISFISLFHRYVAAADEFLATWQSPGDNTHLHFGALDPYVAKENAMVDLTANASIPFATFGASALDPATTAYTFIVGIESAYGTFRLNFHRFDRFELDLRGHTQP